MRKIFEDANTLDNIEFMKGQDNEYMHMFIDIKEKPQDRFEFLFTESQVLQIISELSLLLIKK